MSPHVASLSTEFVLELLEDELLEDEELLAALLEPLQT